MARFDLSDYEPVEDRLRKFWADHPEGRIFTDLLAYGESQFILRADVYRNANDPHPWTTGYAEERVTDRGVNSTSALENGETSAIGRALANAGYATKGKRPSREEMQKVQRLSQPKPEPLTDSDKKTIDAALAAIPSANTDELKALWKTHLDHLDIDLGGTTLREAILARKDAIERAA